MHIPQFIAHRGLSAHAPENTFAAFNLAKKQGYTMFECDVQLTSDEVPIIIHDDEVDRTTNGTGRVAELNFAAIENLDAGIRFAPDFEGEKIPSLKALLNWLTQNQMSMNLELKGRSGEIFANERLAEVVSATIKAYFPVLKNRLLISSFEFEALVRFKACLAELPLGVLIDQNQFKAIGFEGVQMRLEKLEAASLNLDKQLIRKDLLPTFLKMTSALLVYTVSPPQAEALFKQGVTAVFTNG